nr:pre-mRNA splicing Prp18-interacting factor [Tanacetum cinerariifolium]
ILVKLSKGEKWCTPAMDSCESNLTPIDCMERVSYIPKSHGRITRWWDDEKPRNQILTLKRNLIRSVKWMEAKVASFEVESERKPRKGQNRIKTGQKREAWQSQEKFKAVAVDRGRKTEENKKRMIENAYTCGTPLYGFLPCQWCTCEHCGVDLRDGFCPLCNSSNSCVHDPDPNSFDYPPDSYNPPHPTYETYSGDSCGNNSQLGYDCQTQFPLNYEPEPSYIQDYNSYPHDSSSSSHQLLCCDNCGGLHETFQCQPTNQNFYNSNSSDFDQSHPSQFPVSHQPPQETSIETLHDQENEIDSMQTFLRKFNRISFFETPKVLLLAWDKIFKIKNAFGNKQYKPEDTLELFRDLFNDVQNIREELAEYINTPGWNHLDSTLKNDRFNTEPYLLESLLNHDTLMASSLKIDSLLVEFTDELIFLKSIPTGIDEANCDPEEDIHLVERLLYDNSSPRPPKEFVSENSNANLKSFSPSPIPVEDSDSFMEEIDLSFNLDDPMPPVNCNSRTGNSFTYDLIPESFNEVSPNPPPQFHFNIYLCQICESNSHYGYECSQRVPLVYEPEPCYIQNFSDNDYSHDLPSIDTLIDHHCCYECGNSLNDFFCHQCTYEFCRNGAHVGYNCPAQVPSFQTLPSFPQQYPCCEDCGEDIRLIERLLYDNSSPHPPKEFVSNNSDADIESFSLSPIPVEDSGSHMEEIDLSFNPDDPMPPSIKEDDDDSKRDILILEELLDNYSLSLPINESFHFDIPSFSRPPAKPPNGNTGILNIKMMGDISNQKVPMPRLMITR